MSVNLVQNDNVIGTQAGDTVDVSDYTAVSQTVVLNMQQGDTCFVRSNDLLNWAVGHLYSTSFSKSSFAGWKI